MVIPIGFGRIYIVEIPSNYITLCFIDIIWLSSTCLNKDILYNYITDPSSEAGPSNTETEQSSSRKPKLTIDTNQHTTGNSGIDAESKWRRTSANCTHSDLSIFTACEGDGSLETECDMTSELEVNRSNIEKEMYPKKHLAFEKAGDEAFVCRGCNANICQKCWVDYGSEEEDSPLPSQVDFPETTGKFTSDYSNNNDNSENT